MDWNFLWYVISTLLGVVTGALGTAWTWGRRFQSILDTQKKQGDSLQKQADSLDALWTAHQAHKVEVDKRLTETGGKMMQALADIKQSVAVIQTQTKDHADNCVTQKDTKEIAERLARIEGAMGVKKEP